MVSQAPLDRWNTPVIETVYLYILFCPLPQILCLFMSKAHVCSLKMNEGGLNAYFVSSHSMSQAV
jgi:hypothetical protein